jgi:hypothetical protein
MFAAMLRFGSLNVKELDAKFTSMGYDGNIIFHGARVDVTTQMKYNVAPFMIGMHCFTY